MKNKINNLFSGILNYIRFLKKHKFFTLILTMLLLLVTIDISCALFGVDTVSKSIENSLNGIFKNKIVVGIISIPVLFMSSILMFGSAYSGASDEGRIEREKDLAIHELNDYLKKM